MPTPSSKTVLIEITCPACAGVLHLVREPATAHVHVTCQVGHRFSLASLLATKEDELERVLWASMCFLEHVETISSHLLDEIAQSGLPIRKTGLEARIRMARAHHEQIRRMIEETDPPDLDQDMEPSQG